MLNKDFISLLKMKMAKEGISIRWLAKARKIPYQRMLQYFQGIRHIPEQEKVALVRQLEIEHLAIRYGFISEVKENENLKLQEL